ncbi:MAG: CPBP family intramembrane metalloprotease [Anaerolineaceae bacterium]|nr:CPBP family intramembrane metalloprotease [Anaerolineaceae bacterium]
MKTYDSFDDYPQHSVLTSILLHILPGGLVTLGMIVFKPLFDASGYPPLLVFLLAVVLIDLPVMWGILLYRGWKQNGRLSLGGFLFYREKLPWGKFALFFIGTFVVTYLLIMLVTPVTSFMTERVFFGLPDWMFFEEQTQYQTYPKIVLVVVFSLQLILTGIVLPWTEELYFRGYLLPRIARYKRWAPLIGGLLFGLYHCWQPFGFFSVFLLGTVLNYLVWWQRDLRLSIWLHITANVMTRLIFLFAALSM